MFPNNLIGSSLSEDGFKFFVTEALEQLKVVDDGLKLVSN